MCIRDSSSPPTVGLKPIFSIPWCRCLFTLTSTAYTPLPGINLYLSWTDIFAVGNPISRPICLPFTTIPETLYWWPRYFEAVLTSPSKSAFRISRGQKPGAYHGNFWWRALWTSKDHRQTSVRCVKKPWWNRIAYLSSSSKNGIVSRWRRVEAAVNQRGEN